MMRIKNFKWEDEVFYNDQGEYDRDYHKGYIEDLVVDDDRDDISEVIYDLEDYDGKTY